MDRVTYRIKDVLIEASSPFEDEYIVTLTHTMRGWSETHLVDARDWPQYEKWLDQTAYYVVCPIHAKAWYIPEQLFCITQKVIDNEH